MRLPSSCGMVDSEPRNPRRIKNKGNRVRFNVKNRRRLSKKRIYRILSSIKKRKSRRIRPKQQNKIIVDRSLQKKFRLMFRREKHNEYNE